MWIRIIRTFLVVTLLSTAVLAVQPALAQLPTPSQPILVVQDSTSTDPYQNFVPELLTTEGLNGFQTAQLSNLTTPFLANYDVVILPHLALTSGEASLFQVYVNAGGTLIGFRPDLQLANVFGVTSLGTTLAESWLQINATTPYAPNGASNVMKFHGTADLYSLNGATALATLYTSATTPTASPATTIYTSGSGTAILFSYDLTQTIALMRQGNPAWAGYPNNHDGFNTMRASQMFMDIGSGQFWNDLGDGTLNNTPQADIQMRLLSNAITLTNAAKRPLPRLWYYPNQSPSLMLMTADDHSYPESDALTEFNFIASYGGLFSYNLWDPFVTIDPSVVASWLAAGDSLGIHFNDTAEVDSSGVGGSAATWNGMLGVMTTAFSDFSATYPTAPFPNTTRNHYIMWVSNDADGTADQVANAKLFQNNGIQLDTSYSSFPARWGYMTGSGLPMKFLDTVAGTVIPVYEQATQYEDDVQLSTDAYSLDWNQGTAQSHYVQTLSDSMTKYNSVTTFLFHPETWGDFQSYAQAALQYAQTNSISMTTTGNWLTFWQARAATTLSMPSFTSGTLSFTATGAPAGLTLLVPAASGTNMLVSTFQVDGTPQTIGSQNYQGVLYASAVLATAGTHNISVTYTAAGRILGQITPTAAATSTTIQVQGGSISESIPVAANGTYVVGPLPAGTYTVTPTSSVYAFSPLSQTVTLGTQDVPNIDFNGVIPYTGETLFTTQTPTITNQSDGPSINYEMGTAFTSGVPGEITGVRFWKAPSEAGTHTGKIWSNTGTLLGSVTFANETASGWQQQTLATPVLIPSGTTYVVSVNTANSYYVDTPGGLSSIVTNEDLSSVVPGDGVFASTPGQFPTQSFGGGNYFRDIFFTPAAGYSVSGTISPSSAGTGTTLTLTGSGTAVATADSSGNYSFPEVVTGSYTLTPTNTNYTFNPPSAQVVVTGGNVTGVNFTASTLPTYSISGTIGPLGSGNGTGATVTLSGTASASTTADSNGNYTFSGLFNGSYTVTPSKANFTMSPTSAPVTVSSSNVTGVNFTATAIPTYTISGTVGPLGSGNGTGATVTLSGTASASTTADSNGNYTFSGLFNGSYTVTPSKANFTMSPTSAPVTVSSSNVTGVNFTATAIPTYTISGTVSPAGNAATLYLSGASTGSTTPNASGNYAFTGLLAGSYTVTPYNFGYSFVPSSLPVTLGPSSATGVNFAAVANPPAETIFTTQTPVDADQNDGVNYEMGTAFTSDVAGEIVAVRYWKALNDAGVHTGNIWSSSGTLLASVVFTNETASGWQQQYLTSPVFIAASTTYVVSVNTASGYYAASGGGLSSPVINGDLSTVVPNDGLFIQAPGQFPTSSFGGANYFRDVYFIPNVSNTPSSVTLNPTNITGGSTTTGTVTLVHPVPFGQTETIALSASNPLAQPHTIQSVTDQAALQADGSLTWSNMGPPFFNSIASGSVVAVSGITGLNATITNNLKLPLQFDYECPADNCIWAGDFSPGADVLWDGGAVINNNWTGAGPMTVAFSSPQRGFGVQVEPDEPGPFTATICAFDSSNNQLGCSSVSGNGTDNPAHFIGIYDDTQEIASVTVDAGGSLYPHDFAIGDAYVVNAEKQLATVPATVSVPAGATTATFTVTTNQVSSTTSLSIIGNDNGTQSATLTLTPPVLYSILMNADTVPGGTSSTGTVTLNQPAPSGGALITLTNDVPVAQPHTIQSVGLPGALEAGSSITPSALQPDGMISWSTLGPPFYTNPASGFTTPVSGIPGLNVTISNAHNFPLQYDLECPAFDCVWSGNFNPGADVLWDGGAMVNGQWTGAGPMTVTFSSPQRGLGFQISPDELGAFTATMCAYDSGNTQLGCASFNGAGSFNNSSIPIGIYDDTQEIASVTVDAGGALYPHDFAIGDMFITSAERPVIAVVPTSVTVPAGQTTATFNVTTNAVNTNTFVDITGTYNGTQAVGTVQVTAIKPGISSVSISSGSVVGGTPSSATVTLTSPAVVGGATVALSSSNPAASVPATVNIPAHATTMNFTVNTSAVASVAMPTITAALNNTTGTGQLTVTPPGVVSLSLNPTSVNGGTSSTGTVTISSPAPSGGIAVPLSSDNAAAGVSSTVTVASGATTANFTVTTVGVATTTTPNITATLNGTASAPLTVNPPVLLSLSLNPTSIAGGSVSVGTVTLNGPAPSGGIAVALSSGNTAAALVTTPVTVAGGATTANFNVTGVPSAATATSLITATLNGSQSATLTVTPVSVVVSSVTFNPASIVGGVSGQTSTGTVNLNVAAPAGGTVVTLTSGNTAVATVPASVTVSANSTSATFAATPVAVGVSTGVSISAKVGSTTAQSGTLTVIPASIISVSLNPTSVTGNAASPSSVGTVTLNGPAAGTAAQRTVTFGNSSTAGSTPASVAVTAGATTATFNITTSSVATTTTDTITGTLNGSANAALTINQPALVSVTLNLTSVTGGSVNPTGTVTLNAPAPTGGLVVSLTSDNPTAASVPASGTVTVAAGSKTATFTVTSHLVEATAVANISGTYNGVTQTAPTLSVTVAANGVFSLTLNPTSVAGGTTSTGTITLNGTAPSGGASVTVTSSNTAYATVTSPVTVPANASSVTFTVTSLTVTAVESPVITATYNGIPQTATLTVNPPALASVTLNNSTVTGGLTNPTGTVTLTGPAPTGGIVVTVTSSNTAAATVPATVTVTAGNTTKTFTVTSHAVGTQASVTITGSFTGSPSQTATLTVNPPAVSSVTLSPTSVIGGASSTGTVHLNVAAPTGGILVSLASNNGAATVPGSVTVAAAATTATFTITTNPVTAATTPSISGSFNGGTQSATLTVNPPTISSVALSPTTVTHPASSTGTVTISGAAPAGGFVVNLSSSNTAVATVPATATVAAGQTTVQFTVTTLTAAPGNGRITISASQTGSTTRTATLTVD